LAKNLVRIEVPSEVEQARIREAAYRLAQTEWRQGTRLETVPYLDGVPVGAARRVPAVWSGTTLYVAEASVAQMAAPVAREIARGFDHVGIGDAVKFCFERDSSFIIDYLDHEFTLGSPLFEIQEKRAETTPEALEFFLVEVQPGQYELTQEAPEPVQDQEQYNPQYEPVGEQPGAAPEPTRNHQHREPNRPDKPSLMERYAAVLGLRSDGNGQFIGDDIMLARVQDSVFPWELRSLSEGLFQRLLPQEQCLDRGPITVDSEVWGLLQVAPENYALLVITLDDEPVLLTGSQLNSQLKAGRIQLFPARYRLAKVI
jgi:hypothetical protein